jgi:hypothetical protein
MMKNIPYTISDKSISFVFKNRPRQYYKDDTNFKNIKAAVISNDFSALETIIDPRKIVAKVTKGNIVIADDGGVYYKNEQLPDYLAKRLVMHYNNGDPIEPLCAFTEKLMGNPNKELRTDLFKWLEVGNTPLFPEGDFLAYKKVQADYLSYHNSPDGTKLDHNIGKVVTMKREDCDADRNSTCSTGLHFCSFGYLRSYNGSQGRVVIVKINPAHVVAIPQDYNTTKGRCCQYEIIAEVPEIDAEKFFDRKLVVDKVGTYVSPTPIVAKDKPPAISTEIFGGNDPKKIKECVDATGVTAAATKYNVARSTIQRWMARINGTNDVSFVHPATGAKVYGNHVRQTIQTSGSKTEAARRLDIHPRTLGRWEAKL